MTEGDSGMDMGMDTGDVPARLIRLAGTSNLRDVGGYRAEGGRTVRHGCIYRSGAMPRLGEEGWRWMHASDVAVVCDLRSEPERALAPTQWRGPDRTQHIHADYDAMLIYGRPVSDAVPGAPVNDMHLGLYPLFPEMLAPALRRMFEALLDARVPLIVHCSAGQDRTGLAIGLILDLLGVSRADILEDYLLSTRCRSPENELDRDGLWRHAETNVVARFYTDFMRNRGHEAVKPKPLVDAAGEAMLAHGFRAIEQRWGSLPAYLDDQLGIGPAAVEKMRDLYLERSSAGDGFSVIPSP